MRLIRRIGLMVAAFMMAGGAVMVATRASGELTISIQPGYQFSEGELPTTDTLNQAATPTATVTGTLGGTNVALGANTVSGTMLMDSVAGSNLTYNSASPRGLVIADSGVNVSQVATNLLGIGLTGGAGAKVTVTNLPVSRLTVTTNTIVGGGAGNVLATSSGFHIGSGTLSLSNFNSIEFALAAGPVANTNHSLGAAPNLLRWVLVCKTADANYAIGDEVGVDGFYNAISAAAAFAVGANATNVFMIQLASGDIHTRDKSDGSSTTITQSRWRAKCYARP